MRSIPARLIAAVAVLATLCLLAACGGADNSSDQSGTDTSDAPVITGEPAGYNSADVSFATAMVPHHQQAIDLSTMAAQNSTNPELIAMANQIVAAQQPEVNILNVFLVQWNENPEIRSGPDTGDGAGPAPTEGMIDDATVARLGSMRGPDFDKLWLQSMITQHQGAVAIAQSEIDDGKNVDAVAVAKTILSGQQADIAHMKKMLEGMP